MRSAFGDVKMACDVDVIGRFRQTFVVCFCSSIKACSQLSTCSQVTLPVSALYEKGDTLPRAEDVEAERDEALRRVESVSVSLSAEDTDLQALRCVAGELQSKHDIVFR